MINTKEFSDRPGPSLEHGRIIIQQLSQLLEKAFADLDVPRERIKEITTQGRLLAADVQMWPGGVDEAHKFQADLDSLERKLFQILDLRRLKAEGLVKAVRLP